MTKPLYSRGSLIGLMLMLLACALLFASEAVPASHLPKPDAARSQVLLHLLREDCGACHGLTRQGGLGSPLTAAALAGKPADSLVATILDGRPGTAMPPWRPFISEQEARWLVELLQQDLPR
ncbi:cytochrome c [Vogesella sp. XCS3]|jgi:cytochrome c55X|uniref:c-type cytochrome n=1 Tax=Vogesella sp. XCS3 TaxID=2877939 RepID=UPI000380FC9F|nr:cytochrome c [Vogesella sp. XCS3]UDM16804.1 cytochrome c [Vogesella sp. XCS3]